MVSLFVFECYAISRPYFPAVATNFINPIVSTVSNHPPYLPFQLITLFRKLALTLYIAFSQIGPLLQSPEMQRRQGKPEVALKGSLDRLDLIANLAENGAGRLVDLEMSPYKGNVEALEDMQTKVRQHLVQNEMYNDPAVKKLLDSKRIQRRRADAPAGARGNR